MGCSGRLFGVGGRLVLVKLCWKCFVWGFQGGFEDFLVKTAWSVVWQLMVVGKLKGFPGLVPGGLCCRGFWLLCFLLFVP